jgi:hypothetical protein
MKILKELKEVNHDHLRFQPPYAYDGVFEQRKIKDYPPLSEVLCIEKSIYGHWFYFSGRLDIIEKVKKEVKKKKKIKKDKFMIEEDVESEEEDEKKKDKIMRSQVPIHMYDCKTEAVTCNLFRFLQQNYFKFN